MDYSELIAICEKNGCECLRNFPLAAKTSFKIGGNADLFADVRDKYALRDIISFVKSRGLRFLIIGKGSNLLISDEGFRGVVISVEIGGISVENDVLTCGAGVSLGKASHAALSAGLTGLEFAGGIPGTVGGGVYMNAGAYGGDIGQVTSSVSYLDTDTLEFAESRNIEFGYRRSTFSVKNHGIITSAAFSLSAGDASEIRAAMEDYARRRAASQPLELPSAGSTFKRPEGDYAARLIDVCGLKNASVGGACVSGKHAGFIVNTGGATFKDVTALIKKVQKTVFDKEGVLLELEVKIIAN